ncbi:hypothetical protein [Collibacillus ludicampi]|nr:hypothetical protein [Collibacillus ludicampi]
MTVMDQPLLLKNRSELNSSLRHLVEQWYVWLCSKPNFLFQHENETRMHHSVSNYHHKLYELQQSAIAQSDWFIHEGSQVLIQAMTIEKTKGETDLGEFEDTEEKIQKLSQLLERWYSWLGSTPEPLFRRADYDQMKNPVIYFHEAIDWLSRTTIVNTEWFFSDGSQIVMNRWLKGDYDSYE